jgi:phage-related minor tail protein
MPVVDLRFMVHNKKDIVDATKSLKEFNVANVQRAANHDKVAAADLRGMKATNQLRRLTKTLQADLMRLEKEGILTQEELIAKGQEYNLMLAQRERELKNFVETDRVALAQAKREQKMVDESVKKTKRLAGETEKLKRQYSSSYAALQKYKEAVKGINQAWGGDKTAQGRAALKALRKDYDDFTNALQRGSIVDAGNQFARYGDQAYRATQKTKRFASVGLQQAGYQVNDFIVQVASGQNALVAFGQQGSQFAGIFGTGGAVVGAIIAGIAALGNLAYQMYNAEQSVEELSEAFSELGSQVSAIESMGDQLESVLKAPMSLARYELAKLLADMKKIDLKNVRSEISKTFGMQYQTKFNKLIGQHVPIVGKVVIQKEGILADMQDVLAEMQEADTLARKAAEGKTVQHRQHIVQIKQDIDDLAVALGTPIKSQQDLIKLGYALNDIVDGRKGKLQDQVRLFLQESGILDLMVDQQVELAEAQEEADKNAKKAQEEKKALALQMRKANIKHLEDEHRAIEAANKKEVAHLNRIYAFNQRITDQITNLNKKEQDQIIAKMKTEGDIQNARELEIRQAQQIAYNRAMAGHEALKMSAAEYNTMQALAVEAGKAAAAAVERKHASEDATTALRESKEDARELAKALQDAARATEVINSINFSVEDKIATMKARIAAVQSGGDGQLAGQAVSGYLRAKRKLEESAGDEGLSTEAIAKLEERKTLERELYDLAVQYKELTKSDKESGGKEKLNAIELLTKEWAEMDLNLKKREALIGLTEEEITLQNTKMQLFDKVKDKLATMDEGSRNYHMSEIARVAEMIAAEEKRIRLLEEHEEHQKNVADTIANSMGDALTSIVDGTKSVSDAFKDMARAIIAELYQIFVVKQITGMISSAIAPHVPGVQLAKGGVISNGQLVPYASGGVVSAPTMFPMSGGKTGLMGEAGPEAIMPLKRGKNGKLGVQADGGSGDVIIHQNFNFTANGDESVKQIIAQQAPAIANMTKKQIMDDRRRGGQMKQAFG